MEALTARSVTIKYGDLIALNRVNISVKRGEKVAIVGSANCGKTTALRMFAGLATPTSGECYVLGNSPSYDAHKVHAYTGFVTESAKLYENLTLNDNLALYAKIYGIEINDAIERISYLLHSLDIFDSRDKLIRKLSTASLQKANIARALIHKPQVLLLDEPTTGLDKETTDSVSNMIDTVVKNEDATAVLCTRHLHHAEQICDRYLIMKDAEIIARGDIEELRLGCGLKYKAVFRISDESEPPIGFEFSEDGTWFKEIDSEDEMSKLLSTAVYNGCDINEAIIKKPSLKEIYDEYITGRYIKVGENIAKGSSGAEPQTERKVIKTAAPIITERDLSLESSTEEFISENIFAEGDEPRK